MIDCSNRHLGKKSDGADSNIDKSQAEELSEMLVDTGVSVVKGLNVLSAYALESGTATGKEVRQVLEQRQLLAARCFYALSRTLSYIQVCGDFLKGLGIRKDWTFYTFFDNTFLFLVSVATFLSHQESNSTVSIPTRHPSGATGRRFERGQAFGVCTAPPVGLRPARLRPAEAGGQGDRELAAPALSTVEAASTSGVLPLLVGVCTHVYQ